MNEIEELKAELADVKLAIRKLDLEFTFQDSLTGFTCGLESPTQANFERRQYVTRDTL